MIFLVYSVAFGRCPGFIIEAMAERGDHVLSLCGSDQEGSALLDFSDFEPADIGLCTHEVSDFSFRIRHQKQRRVTLSLLGR